MEWLGRIPAHWTTKPFKALLSRNDSGVWGEDGGDNGTIVLRSTEQTVEGSWSLRNPAKRLLTPREASHALLEIGDLVVTKSSGSDLHIGKASIVDESVARLGCAFSNFMQRLRVRPDQDPLFFWYLLNSPVAREQFVLLSSTATGLGNLSRGTLGAIQVPIVPAAEQHVISRFLDRETARIDALITKMERLIELLQEKRAALITRAITEGLDPSVPMKDSGVEWLGAIPAHSEVKRLWHLTAPGRPIMYGIVLPGPNVEDGIPIVKGGDVSPERLRLDLLSRTSREIESGYVRSRLCGGDIVYAIRGSIGEAAVIPDELDGANLTQDAARVSYRSVVCGRWLLYCLKSSAVFAQLEAGAQGATIRGINIGDLKRASLPVPPLDTQRATAALLDRETARIDALVSKVREAIDRLKELRTALISAAVTGKIDVRDVHPGSGGPLLPVTGHTVTR